MSDKGARPANVVLEVDRLGKRYAPGGPPAIDDVSFAVNEGEVLSIVGPSGCGKSTTLRLLAGLLRPTTGCVRLHGKKVDRPPAAMAVVFQDYSRSLFPWLTVLGNVQMPLTARRGRLRRDARPVALEALERVHLADVAGRYPWQLSGGMQQRVAIARSLVVEPEILLLDEPFASLDALTRADLEDLVLEVHDVDRAMTMILVTHDIDEAVYLSDRVLVFGSSPGRLVAPVAVDLPRPREQLATRSDPRFLEVRNDIHAMIRRLRDAASPASPLTVPLSQRARKLRTRPG